MRRVLIAAWAALGVACASASPPPGGAEDHEPPQLVRVTPDTNALNVTDKVVSFYFDETINDRGSGALEVSNFFLVSPSDGNARVSWHRSRIDVRPRLGFRPNTAYTVTLLPGLSDLRNNIMKTGRSVVFSTGSSIPPHRITGTVFDWSAERPAVRALLQAVTPDSITYLAQSDSIGQFSIGPLPEGTYLVRGVIDANNNRALDRNEAYDSAQVTTPQRAPLELLTIVRDTLPPRITTVAAPDSVSLRVSFDRPLDQTALPAVDAFRLIGPDSAVIAMTAVITPRQEVDAAKATMDAKIDSVRRADSVAGRTPVAPAVTPAPAVRPGGKAGPAGVAAPLPKPRLPAPPSGLLLHLARPLLPNTLYRLSVHEARSLSGRSASSERSFTTPKPPPPPAPARVPADSARKPTTLPKPPAPAPKPPA